MLRARRMALLSKLAESEDPKDEIDRLISFSRNLRQAFDAYTQIPSSERDKKLELGKELIKRIENQYNNVREFVGGKVHEDYWEGASGLPAPGKPSKPSSKPAGGAEPAKSVPSVSERLNVQKREKPQPKAPAPAPSVGDVSDVEMMLHSVLDHAFSGKDIPDELIAKLPPKMLMMLQRATQQGDLKAFTSLPQSIQHRLEQQAKSTAGGE